MMDFPLVIFLNTEGVFVFIGFVLLYFWFIGKQRREFLRIFLSIITAAFVSIILKNFFAFPRPFEVEGQQAAAGLVGSSSLPSFHAAVAFAAATNVTFHKRKLGIILLLVAFIIGLGRILADVHYPIDIFMGVIIGTIIAIFIEAL